MQSSLEFQKSSGNLKIVSGGQEVVTDCPQCGREGKFYWNKQKQVGHCKVCNYSPNLYTLLDQNNNIYYPDNSIEKKVNDYHQLTGKTHRLSKKVIDHFEITVKEQISNKGNAYIALCLSNSDNITTKRLIANKWMCPNKKDMPIDFWHNIHRALNKDQVYIVAGEWDMFSCWEHAGIDALSPITGETKRNHYPEEALNIFKDKEVIIIYDNDQTGIEGANALASAIEKTSIAKSIKVFEIKKLVLKEKGDIDDYFSQGGTFEELFKAIDETDFFKNENIQNLNSDYLQLPETEIKLDLENFNYGIPDTIANDIWKASFLPAILMDEALCKIADIDLSENLSVSAKVRGYNKTISEMQLHQQEILIKKYLKDNNVVVNEETEERFKYFDGVYISITDDEIVLLAEDISRKTTKRINAKQVNQIQKNITFLIETELKSVKKVKFNKAGDFINLQNGVLNIKTCELNNHTPDLYTTIKLPILYKKDADCPNWKHAILTWISTEEDRRELQKIFYYILSGDLSAHKAFVFIGDGRNGKSTCVTVIEELVGKEQVSHMDFESLFANDFATWGLNNKLLNIVPEVQYKTKFNDGRFKAITGGDKIDSDRKFKERVTWENTARFVILTNNYFNVSDTSYGFYSRFKYIKFSSIPSANRIKDYYKNYLQNELSGILSWVLAGYKLWIEDKGFIETSMNKSILYEARLQADSVSLFWEEKIAKDNGITDEDKDVNYYDDFTIHKYDDGRLYIDSYHHFIKYYKEWATVNNNKSVKSSEFFSRTKRFFIEKFYLNEKYEISGTGNLYLADPAIPSDKKSRKVIYINKI